jgi:hypothetical protein
MAIQQPPVLKKVKTTRVKKPTDEQILVVLKSIDTRIDNITSVQKKVDKAKPVAKKTVTRTSNTKEKKEVKPKKEKKPITPRVNDEEEHKKNEKKKDNFFKSWAKAVAEDRAASKASRSKKEQEGLTSAASQMIRGVMGPLNLITQPLGELLGKDMDDLTKYLFMPKDEKTKKKTKEEYSAKGKVIKPKRSDILKSNPEDVYVVDELKKKSKKDTEENSSFLDSLLSGLGAGGVGAIAKKLWPALLKAAPFAAIAGGLIWATIDGIKSMGEAEKWGVDKVPAFLGGFFSGNGEGWKAVLGNAAKWGLVGLGVGALIGGPIGAIAGALVGAALGGVFNWIGAENVSKTFNDIAVKLGLTEDKTQAGRTQDEIFKKKGQIASTYEKLWDQGKFDDTTFGENSAKKTQKIKDVLNAKNYSSFTADAYGSNAMYLMDELNNINSLLSTLNYLPAEQAKGKQAELEAKQKAIIDALGKLDVDPKDRKKTNADYLFNELNTKYGYSFTPFEKQKESGVVKVNDAIIAPDGRIIQPSTQDTIIATKSPVYNKNFDNQQFDFDSMNKTIESSFNGREIIDAINKLIDVVRTKPFNNVIQNRR